MEAQQSPYVVDSPKRLKRRTKDELTLFNIMII